MSESGDPPVPESSDPPVPEAPESPQALEQPAAVSGPPPPTPEGSMLTEKSADQRRKLLAQAIQTEVVQGGRIETQQDFQAVIVHGKPVNHLLHLLITLVTCLIWGIVWLVLVLTGGEKRVLLVVDDYGNVLRQKV